MTDLQLRTHRAVTSAVGDGAAYWHPDISPGGIAAMLHEVCGTYRQLLGDERLIRAAKGLPMPRADKRMVMALMVIRQLRPHLTAELWPREIHEVNTILLKMLLRAAREETKTGFFLALNYICAYNYFAEPTGLSTLLELPLHYDRLAR